MGATAAEIADTSRLETFADGVMAIAITLHYLVPTSGPRPALPGAHAAAGEQGAVGGQ